MLFKDCRLQADDQGGHYQLVFCNYSNMMVLPDLSDVVKHVRSEWDAKIQAPPAQHRARPSAATPPPSAAPSAGGTLGNPADSAAQQPVGPAAGTLGDQSGVGASGTGSSAAASDGGLDIDPAAAASAATNRLVKCRHSATAEVSTVKQILQHGTVPARFRCIVRISDCLPRRGEDLVQPYCTNCRQCAQLEGFHEAANSAAAADAGEPKVLCEKCHGEIGEWRYKAVLKLEDDTGALPAVLWEDDAVQFFGGVPASQFREDAKVRSAVHMAFQRLRATAAAANQPPPGQQAHQQQAPAANCPPGGTRYEAELCIKSYYVVPHGRRPRKRRKPGPDAAAVPPTGDVSEGAIKMFRIFDSEMYCSEM